MTEAEWLASTDPQKMLDFLRGKASDRKLRLFAVACCRRVWRSLRKIRSRKAVEVVEQCAEGLVDVEKLDAAQAAAHDAWLDTDDNTIEEYAARLAVEMAGLDAGEAAIVATKGADVKAHVSVYAFDPDDPPTTKEPQAAYESLRSTEQAMQCGLIRCIFGDPFRPLVLESGLLAWSDGTIVKLAQAAYDERHLPEGTLHNGRLAILADAFEEAGCTDAEILSHLREPKRHVRGCWVIDALIGKS